MDYILLFLLIIVLIFNVVLLFKFSSIKNLDEASLTDSIKTLIGNSIKDMESNLAKIEIEQQTLTRTQAKELNDYLVKLLTSNNDHANQILNNSINTLTSTLSNSDKTQRELIRTNFIEIINSLNSALKANNEYSAQMFDNIARTLSTGMTNLTNTTETKLNLLTASFNENFLKMREETNQQIDKIRDTVNEKLDKTINEQFEKSFKGVLSQMNDLQRSMGELKSISTQVGSLEKTLNGVKTRGIMGEVQLKSIIADVLTPNQYDIEVPTKPDSKDHVEIAIKLPDRNSDNYIYLPIDSKCHLDRYEELLDAYDSGDRDMIKDAKTKFTNAIREDAKNICEKYISIPDTTPYAILFVPFEGMYSEIVNLNLLEDLNKYHITVAGPYTLMAILSTVTNYFQALAIEKKSHDIERTLGMVKVEFGKYNEALSKVRSNLDTATKNLETLQTRRTRAIEKALKDITTLDAEPLLSDNLSLPIDSEDYE